MQGGGKRWWFIQDCCFESHLMPAWQRNITINGKEIPSEKKKNETLQLPVVTGNCAKFTWIALNTL